MFQDQIFFSFNSSIEALDAVFACFHRRPESFHQVDSAILQALSHKNSSKL